MQEAFVFFQGLHRKMASLEAYVSSVYAGGLLRPSSALQ